MSRSRAYKTVIVKIVGKNMKKEMAGEPFKIAIKDSEVPYCTHMPRSRPALIIRQTKHLFRAPRGKGALQKFE